MRLKSWLWNDAFLPLACSSSCGFRAARLLISSSHPPSLLTAIPIPSRGRYADGVAVPITLRPTPRPLCRGTGRTCLDFIGCHTLDTVIYDSGGAFALSSLPAVISSSHHLIPFPSSPYPLSPALSCLLASNNPPPPGVGDADE